MPATPGHPDRHTNSMNQIDDLTIKPVDKTNWPDFEALFQSKGGPKYCWCMVWRMTKDELKNNNSGCRKNYIKERVWSGIPIGILALSGNNAVAWCSIAPRDTHRRLVNILIEEAKQYARNNGAGIVEAYPVREDSPSYRFMGFIRSFEKAGFEYVKKAGSRRHVMIFKL